MKLNKISKAINVYSKASLKSALYTTEFGMCITSYLSEPCTKYRDCINCNEHVCTKGDDGKCERIRLRLKREKKLLEQDKKAVDANVQGAEQWYQRRALTTERLVLQGQEYYKDSITRTGTFNSDNPEKVKRRPNISQSEKLFSC